MNCSTISNKMSTRRLQLNSSMRACRIYLKPKASSKIMPQAKKSPESATLRIKQMRSSQDLPALMIDRSVCKRRASNKAMTLQVKHSLLLSSALSCHRILISTCAQNWHPSLIWCWIRHSHSNREFKRASQAS